jgi:hypothetical protein
VEVEWGIVGGREKVVVGLAPCARKGEKNTANGVSLDERLKMLYRRFNGWMRVHSYTPW